ncbi:rRNA adenine N-6-methyltransferase family protein [Nocardiopsis sp. NPDC049922]|uniref:rRNA adenine N-6-methyltransferase family protein n=1 Tax=Nocardiopsis sp. NPDC049922 TaxID=3155157 RepID=UPI0033CB68AC
MTDLDDLHARLVERLDTTDTIRAAFADHPRHHYIPDLIWPDIQGLPLLRRQNPRRWAECVYSDGFVVTQANDGGSGLVNTPSSSSSAPQVMADMIEAANIAPGARVLEIGTGTGWNAAILDSLVGPTGSVTSLEIDPDVAFRARALLAGTRVDVVHGTQPPPGTVFDAVIATCAVRRLPITWLDCLDRGSTLVVPWAPYTEGGPTPIAALRKTGHASAAGPVVRDAAFMRDRTQRQGGPSFPGVGQAPDTAARFPLGSDDLIGRDLLTRLVLACPGIHVAVGGRPWKGGRARLVAVGDAQSWAWIWPDASVTGSDKTTALETFTAAYAALDEAAWPPLDAFTLDVDAQRGVCVVRSKVGSWEHEV